MTRAGAALAGLILTILLAGCGSAAAHRSPAVSGDTASVSALPSLTAAAGGLPTPQHILVAVFENKAYDQLVGSSQAPWFNNSLVAGSALFTNAHAETHPSQPNYLALFSGSTHGVTDDHCPVDLTGQPNLGQQLIAAKHSFTGYSEDLPSPGYLGCSHAGYAAKHNPWVDFNNVPASANQPYTAFPADYSRLPTVAFVIPNLCHDMHDCSIGTGDNWARQNLDGYLRWAKQHNSLLIVTFDEDDDSSANRMLTVIAGAGVVPGRYSQPITHYSLLRTIEACYGLPGVGNAASTPPITNIWH
jgi:acid phosphatase